MAAAYFEKKFEAEATFELFVRSLPNGRGYLLFAGLEQALDFLEQVRFTPEEVDFLRRHPMFKRVSDAFFDYLRDFRFKGEIWAVPEGTPVFPNEPLIRVKAPLIHAQLVETFLLNSVAFPTLVATKAARLIEAAQGRGVIEFGTRRAHGPQAGLLAARASYIGGCMGTSNVEAGFRFGIPTYGTIAHSYIMAHESEEKAFEEFSTLYPDNTILLVDTYDTLGAVDKAIAMGLRPRGIRLDSGDLAELSKQARQKLDAAGLCETKIYASGDLDEFIITRMLAQDTPIDFFAVGTALVTSKDAPSLSAVYKLVELVQNGHARYTAKFSEDKATYPGTKQVFRFSDARGNYKNDVIGGAGEDFADAEPLLACVMTNGRRTGKSPSLTDIREHAQRSLARLPLRHRELKDAELYPVRISDTLRKLLGQVRSGLQ